MATHTITSSEFDMTAKWSPFVDEIPVITRSVTVKNGIGEHAPTYLDFDNLRYFDSDVWMSILPTVQEADEILGRLDECNPPTLQDRWRLHKTVQRLRLAANALEQHIATTGLWLSEDEWCDCDSVDMSHF